MGKTGRLRKGELDPNAVNLRRQGYGENKSELYLKPKSTRKPRSTKKLQAALSSLPACGHRALLVGTRGQGTVVGCRPLWGRPSPCSAPRWLLFILIFREPLAPLNIDTPTNAFRSHLPDDGEDFLLIGNEVHPTRCSTFALLFFVWLWNYWHFFLTAPQSRRPHGLEGDIFSAMACQTRFFTVMVFLPLVPPNKTDGHLLRSKRRCPLVSFAAGFLRAFLKLGSAPVERLSC